MKWAQKFINATMVVKAKHNSLSAKRGHLMSSDPEIQQLRRLLTELETAPEVKAEFEKEEPALKNKAVACYQWAKSVRIKDDLGLNQPEGEINDSEKT